ncbi:unnamed protein product [Acanthoscelides obtectus]|uniref:Uncharacterized protein n=1 Tax=Acanthoscelides obtectus TaxID=200917 RepID=A0A9P0LVL9_ACAOB|nr:unnamed protein product [Acanthoscelides obtectus]CAK1668430.1 hypothetical protein AOBTE_LOCUS26390 [Acanthoscelides obtectus]
MRLYAFSNNRAATSWKSELASGLEDNCAKRKGDRPYVVHEMSHDKFIDWKSYVDRNMTIRKEDLKGEAVS